MLPLTIDQLGAYSGAITVIVVGAVVAFVFWRGRR